MPALAHIAGVPVEEMLYAVPAFGAAAGVSLAWLRARARAVRSRPSALAPRSGIPPRPDPARRTR